MENDSSHYVQAYEQIDELIKSFNKILSVSKSVAASLQNTTLYNQSFEQNTQYAQNLIRISEEAIRQKNKVIDNITLFYKSNSQLKIWDRLIARFNDSLMSAYGHHYQHVDIQILADENALNQFFNKIASENILSTRSLFKEIYKIELQIKDNQRRPHRRSFGYGQPVTQTQKRSLESLVCFQRMRQMNELLLMPQDAAQTIHRLELMNVQYNEDLSKNIENIYKNMITRNSHVKLSIDSYALVYRSYAINKKQKDAIEEAAFEIERQIQIQKQIQREKLKEKQKAYQREKQKRCSIVRRSSKQVEKTSVFTLELLFPQMHPQKVQSTINMQSRKYLTKPTEATEYSGLDTIPQQPDIIIQSKGLQYKVKELNNPHSRTRRQSNSEVRLKRLGSRQMETQFQKNAIMIALKTPLISPNSRSVKINKSHKNRLKIIHPSIQTFGDAEINKQQNHGIKVVRETVHGTESKFLRAQLSKKRLRAGRMKTSEDLSEARRLVMPHIGSSECGINLSKCSSDFVDPWLFVANKMNLSNPSVRSTKILKYKDFIYSTEMDAQLPMNFFTNRLLQTIEFSNQIQ